MGRANVYLSDELERRVKAAKVPISEVCQAALLAAVEAAEAGPQPLGAAVSDHIRRGWETGTAWAAAAPAPTLLTLLREGRLEEIPQDQLPESWYSLDEEQALAWEAGFAEGARTAARSAATADLALPPGARRVAAPDLRKALASDRSDEGISAGDAPGDGDAPLLGDSSGSFVGVDSAGRRVAFDPHFALKAGKSPLFGVLGVADQRARLTLSIGQDVAARGAAVVVVDLSGELTSRAKGLGRNVRIIRQSTSPLPGIEDLLRGGTNLRGLWETLGGLAAGGGLFAQPGQLSDDLVKPGYVTVVSPSGDGPIAGALSAATAVRTLASLSAVQDRPRLLLVDLPAGVSVPGGIAPILSRLTRTAREHDVAFGLSAESADTVTGSGGSGALLSTVFGFETTSPVEADHLRDLLGASAPVLLSPPGSTVQPGDESWCVMRDSEGRLGQVRIDTV